MTEDATPTEPQGLLDVQGLTDAILAYRTTRFRMETLPAYAVSTDRDDFHRWLRGEREPDWEPKQVWLDQLRSEAVEGKSNTRVRVLTEDLTEYERYECEWGYVYTTAAGEDIRILRPGEHDIPSRLTDRDWWLIDDAQVLAMHYDERPLPGRRIPAVDLDRHLPRCPARRLGGRRTVRAVVGAAPGAPPSGRCVT